MNALQIEAACLADVQREHSFADTFLATVAALPASRAFNDMALARDDAAYAAAKRRFLAATPNVENDRG